MDSVVGGVGGGGTPGPMPNPEAKPSSADGTALARVWESRSPPTFNVNVQCGQVPPGNRRGFLHFPTCSSKICLTDTSWYVGRPPRNSRSDLVVRSPESSLAE